MNKEELLKSSAASIGVELNDTQIQQFIKYHEILVEWNSFMNLTGITEYEDVVQKHFVDSLVLSKAIEVNEVTNLIDIGTGAGFPGNPLKIGLLIHQLLYTEQDCLQNVFVQLLRIL